MVFTIFLAHKPDAHNLSDRGLPKALSTVHLSVCHTWDYMPAIWESWWSEMPAWDLCHISLPPIVPVALIFQRSNNDLNAIKSPNLQKTEPRFNSLHIRGLQIKRYYHPT